MTLVRRDAPETRRTALLRARKALATALSNPAVAAPSTARSVTLTMSCTSSWTCQAPPTLVREEPGFTHTVTRISSGR